MHEAGGGSGMHLSLLCAWVGRVAHKTLALAPRPEAPELAQILNEEGERSFDMHNKKERTATHHICTNLRVTNLYDAVHG